MRSSFVPRTYSVIVSTLAEWAMQGRVAIVVLAVFVNTGVLRAQQGTEGSESDRQTIQMLVRRVEQLEARVAQLEGGKAPAEAVPASTQAASPSAPAESEAENKSAHGMSDRMDTSNTLMRIRGFGDVTFHGDDRKGDTTSFTLGQLNLFVTSDISDKFKFLSEIVFEAGPDNIYGVPRGTANSFGVDVERYLLTYSQNEYFNLSAGRYHTAIGYYNTAFHHSTWLQTTTGRPLLFEFEDQGGILPIHNVGIEANGRIPSGSLGLHYVAELGNGRESRAPLIEEPVQNVASDTNHKAVNFELFARPTKVPGLQVGFSAYRDLLATLGRPAVGETILAAHAVYSRRRLSGSTRLWWCGTRQKAATPMNAGVVQPDFAGSGRIDRTSATSTSMPARMNRFFRMWD